MVGCQRIVDFISPALTTAADLASDQTAVRSQVDGGLAVDVAERAMVTPAAERGTASE